MGLYEDLRILSEQVQKRHVNVRGEEATKQALVLPFLQVLGYDVYDPTQIQPEYIADFAKKKSGPMEKVDYAVHINGEISMFVECKAADIRLDSHDAQLSRYYNSTPSVKLAVLTNGIRYKFFTELQAANMMDAEPFYELDILACTERDAEMLRAFTRADFNATTILTYAEDLVFISKVTEMIQNLLRNPSESFIRFLLGELEMSGRKTQRVVERFVPIVKKAIQTSIVDIMTKSIQEQLPAPQPESPSVAPAPTPAEEADDDGGGKSAIQTTERELAVFEFVKKTCEMSHVNRPIAHKDTVTYFAINLGKTTWWFLRFFSRGESECLVSKLPIDRVQALCPGMKVDEPPEAFGKSRVHLDSPDALMRVRSFIVAAYEDEASQHPVE